MLTLREVTRFNERHMSIVVDCECYQDADKTSDDRAEFQLSDFSRTLDRRRI